MAPLPRQCGKLGKPKAVITVTFAGVRSAAAAVSARRVGAAGRRGILDMTYIGGRCCGGPLWRRQAAVISVGPSAAGHHDIRAATSLTVITIGGG